MTLPPPAATAAPVPKAAPEPEPEVYKKVLKKVRKPKAKQVKKAVAPSKPKPKPKMATPKQEVEEHQYEIVPKEQTTPPPPPEYEEEEQYDEALPHTWNQIKLSEVDKNINFRPLTARARRTQVERTSTATCI